MEEKPSCRLSQRNTELSAPEDIRRRVLFLLLAVGTPLGLVLLVTGLFRHSTVPIVVGGILVVTGLLLGILRRKWKAAATLEEIRANPFKKDKRC